VEGAVTLTGKDFVRWAFTAFLLVLVWTGVWWAAPAAITLLTIAAELHTLNILSLTREPRYLDSKPRRKL